MGLMNSSAKRAYGCGQWVRTLRLRGPMGVDNG